MLNWILVSHSPAFLFVNSARTLGPRDSKGQQGWTPCYMKLPAVTKGCDPWRLGVPIIHSLGDQTPPLCDSWSLTPPSLVSLLVHPKLPRHPYPTTQPHTTSKPRSAVRSAPCSVPSRRRVRRRPRAGALLWCRRRCCQEFLDAAELPIAFPVAAHKPWLLRSGRWAAFTTRTAGRSFFHQHWMKRRGRGSVGSPG